MDISSKYMNKNRKYINLIKDSKLLNKTATTVKHLAILCFYSSRINVIADFVMRYGGLN